MLIVVALAALAPTTADAQIWSSILNEGSSPPGTPTGYFIGQPVGPVINGVGGWAVRTDMQDGVSSSISTIYGSVDGSSTGYIVLAGLNDGLTQTSFVNQGLGFDDAGVPFYRTNVTPDSGTGQRAVYVGTSLLIQEETTIVGGPLDAQSWDSVGPPNLEMQRDGTPWFAAETRTTGGTRSEAVFRGNYERVIGSGDQPPGFPGPLRNNVGVLGATLSVSPNGTQYLFEGVLQTGGAVSSSNNELMVRTGVPLDIGGTLVREGEVVPGGIGGEHFSNAVGDNCAINDSGNYIICGRTTAPSTMDGIAFVNGQIELREGDSVDGVTLGSNGGVCAINADGDWVVHWFLPSSQSAIILNGEVILKTNDPIDFNGNGDPNDDGATMKRVAEAQGLGLQISDRDGEGNVTIFARLTATTPSGEVDGIYRTERAVQSQSCAGMIGDVNGDAAVDGADISAFVACVLADNPPGPACFCADMDGSGSVDLGDQALFVAALLD